MHNEIWIYSITITPTDIIPALVSYKNYKELMFSKIIKFENIFGEGTTNNNLIVAIGLDDKSVSEEGEKIRTTIFKMYKDYFDFNRRNELEKKGIVYVTEGILD